MGEVWKARDESLGRDVAVKLLLQSTPEDVARFHREAQLASRLSHPGIAAIYEFGSDGETPYLTMQFVDGLPLDRAGLSASGAVAAVRDACRAVAFAHSKGIVHRDLKPSNIMIEGRPHQPGSSAVDGRVYVMDFGLARNLKGDSRLTATGLIVGTPAFMPPEQARGESVDARADVYSLGATLYRLLAGRDPFAGADLFALLTSVVSDEAPPLRRINPGIDRELEAVVLKSLEKDPARRYASAALLADDLDRFLRGEPVLARPPSAARRLIGSIRRRPLPYTVLTGVLALAVTFPALRCLQRDRESRQNREAAERILDGLPGGREEAIDALIRADSMARQAGDALLSRRINERLAAVALDGGDFSLAKVALSTFVAPEEADARVRSVRDRELVRRRLRIEQILAHLREGPARPGMIDDYVFEVVRWNDEQTVTLLEGALAPLAEKAPSRSAWTLSERDVMVFAFRVLGRVDLDSAVRPLVAMLGRLRAEDHDLIVECGGAACLTGRSGVYAPLVALSRRLGQEAAAWKAIRPLFERLREPGTAEPRTAMEFMDRAAFRLTRADHSGAIADATRAIELDPQLAPAYLNRAGARLSIRAFEEAIPDLMRVIDLEPRAADAFRSLALAKRGLGDLPGALKAATRAVELDPSKSVAHVVRGQVLEASGLLAAAEADFTSAIAIDGRNAMAWDARGCVRLKMRRAADAIADHSRAVELDPYNAAVLGNRANARADSGDRDGAIEDYNRAIFLDPRRGAIYHNRGVVRRQLGDFAGAIADATKAIELGDLEAYVLRGDAHFKAGALDLACEDYTAAIAANPRFVAAYVARADARQARKDAKGAIADFTRAIELDAANARAYNKRGCVHADLNDLESAIADFSAAIERDGKEAQYYFNRANMLRLRRATKAAVADYTSAIDLDPRYANAYLNRAICHLVLKDFDQAVADCGKAAESDPRQGSPYYVRACAHAERRNYEAAIKDLEKCLSLPMGPTSVRLAQELLDKMRAALANEK